MIRERPARLLARFTAPALLFLAARAVAAPHLELAVELDPGTRAFRAIAEWQGVPTSAFVLDRALTVTAVSSGARRLRFDGRDAGAVRQWRVEGPRPSRLRIEYGGTLAPLDASIDHRGVLGALRPMASDAGSFLPSGAAWVPVPERAFTYRVHLSLPGDQRGIVPGELLAETLPATAAGRYEATYAFSVPVRGIDLMAGPWLVRERMLARAGAAPIRLRTWFPPALDALAEGYLEDSARYLKRYARAIGTYPFGAFSVVASPLPTGFGMPTLTYLGESVLALPFIRATSLGHEVLHNWWGNGVSVAPHSGNWSEGLTTFMADYTYREEGAPEAAQAMRLGWLRDLAALPPGAAQPLSAFRSRAHGEDAAIGYGKSAMLFLMLRDLVGEAAFERSLREFWARHALREAGWRDLQAAFEAASGRALEGFFAQWLERTDAPAPRLVAARAQGTRLTLELAQDAPPYALRLPIELRRGTARETHWVGLGRTDESVTLETNLAPESAVLDPALHVWRRLEPAQLPPILRRWTLARAPRLALATAGLREAAARVAAKFFESAPREEDAARAGTGTDPVLLVGLHADVDAALARLGFARPASLAATQGSAQAWTLAVGAPLAVLSVRDAAALAALERPLPHYGAQSWMVFEAGRAVAHGIWPAQAPETGVQREAAPGPAR